MQGQERGSHKEKGLKDGLVSEELLTQAQGPEFRSLLSTVKPGASLQYDRIIPTLGFGGSG